MMMMTPANNTVTPIKHQQQDHVGKRTSSSVSVKQVFMNRRFYLHFKAKGNWYQATKVIKAFGGQIEDFLDPQSTSYLLTDIPREEWPPNGSDPILSRGHKYAVKIMSFQNLINYCREYLLAQSSSDEDDDLKVHTAELRGPFIKFEDTRRKYQPVAKELNEWPEINLEGPLAPGQTIFGFSSAAAGNNNINSKTRNTSNQLLTPKPSPNPSVVACNHRPRLRKNAVYCEICGIRVLDKLEEHLDSHEHKSNIDNAKWGEVESVIDSLPSLDSLITRKRVQLTNLEEHQEFLCLHKVETISQMFLNSSK